MGLDLNTALISDTFDGLIKTQDGNVLTASPLPIGDGRGNDSSLALATAGNGVTITGTLTVDGNDISGGLTTAQADIIAIEAKTDFITVTGAINLDTVKTKVDFITVTQAVDLDTIESDIAGATAKTDFITVTQNVDLDTMESDILSAKTKTDFITISQAVNLDNVESGLATAQSDITAIETKTDFISVTQAVDLDTVESNAADAKTKTDFLTVTQAVDLDTLESDVNVAKGDITAIEAKTDNITVTQAVNLDTMESDIADAKTKTDFITVTQAVDLDNIESDVAQAQTDINLIEAKTNNITVTQPVDLDAVESDTATALANANNAKAKTDFITVTQAVDLDTIESDLSQAQTDINSIEGKTDFITVTQAVNLDTMESDIATNNAKNSYPAADATKVGFISVTQAVDLDSMETDISNLSNNKYDKTGGTISGDVTVTGDLTVNGTTTTVNTQTLSVEDPLIELANQNSANSVDTGFYANYSLDAGVTTKYAGLFKDAGDSDKFKLFKGLEVEPTTTVDTSGTGYTKGDLVVGDLDAVTISGDFTGNVTATSVLADGVTATTQSAGDNSTKVATTAYVDSIVTAQDLDFAGDSGTGAIDLDSQTLTIAGTANEIETSASGQTITIGLPSSVTVGTLNATTLAGTLSTAAQPNITSVGTLSSLTVGGALNATISTAAQPNITSVGTLSSLAVSGDLNADSGTLFVDSSANAVGIGTTTPASDLHISTAFPEIRLQDDAYPATNHYSTIDGNGGSGILTLSADDGNLAANSAMVFKVDGSEAMRIHSNKVVSVGTGIAKGAFRVLNDSDGGDQFLVLENTKYSGAVSSGETKLMFGWADHIAASITAFKQASNKTGFKIFTENGYNVAQNTVSFPFGGGIAFNGDTVPANSLDDYEEGFWDMTVVPSSSGTITLNGLVNRGAYTKIGRQVTVTGLAEVLSVGSPVGTAVIFSTLPFAVGARLGDYETRIGGGVSVNATSAGNLQSAAAIVASEGNTTFEVRLDASTVQAGTQFYFSFTYFA